MHSSLAILLSIASLALAAPSTSTLNARFSSDEIIYIAECSSGQVEDFGGLAAEYYAKYQNSQNGQQPDSESDRIDSPYGELAPSPEGQTFKFQFPGVVSFNSHIQANGASLSQGQYAGDGDQLVNHKFNKKFQCFKDNGVLYTKADGYGHTKGCRKLYYCRAA